MSKLSLASVALGVVLGAFAACDKGPTKDSASPAATPTAAAAPGAAAAPAPAAGGQSFGAGVTLKEAVSVEAILANPTAFKGKTVRVEGMITDVCPQRGCWFELAGTEPGHKLKFKVTDGDMVFPVDAKGKYAVAQGEISLNSLTLEQTRAYEEEQAKEHGKAFDPATVTTPTTIVRIDGTGALIRDKI